MKKQTIIYTVKVEQTVRETYRIQAQSKEEALQTAAKLWGRAKGNCHKDNNWSVAQQRITGEISDYSESDLEYVDNK